MELLQGIRSLLYKDGYTIRGVQKILKEDGAAYVASVGRGEIVPRKREDEMASAPPPGTAKAAPRVAKQPGAAATAEAPPEAAAPAASPAQEVAAPPAAPRLSDSHTELLRAALLELGEARKILDPTLPQ